MVSSPRHRLVPFDERHAETILGWAESREDREAWATEADLELSPALFESWHGDAGVHPFVLLRDEEPCAYGEVWADEEEGEAELAHVLVAPSLRGQGIGRGLIGLLAERAAGLGFDAIWVRVLPGNGAALSCYGAAGFVRAAPREEAAFNAGQPHRYVWMHRARGPG